MPARNSQYPLGPITVAVSIYTGLLPLFWGYILRAQIPLLGTECRRRGSGEIWVARLGCQVWVKAGDGSKKPLVLLGGEGWGKPSLVFKENTKPLERIGVVSMGKDPSPQTLDGDSALSSEETEGTMCLQTAQGGQTSLGWRREMGFTEYLYYVEPWAGLS